jgi:integrase
MSIRKRSWKTAKGEAREAWVVDYVDQAGKRRLKTFAKKKLADAYHSRANVEVSQGVHTPESTSVTVAEAADRWIASCEGRRLARRLERSTIDSYRSHVKFHISPFLGRVKLSQLSAPMVCDFEDRLRRGDPAPGEDEGNVRSPAMVKKIVGSLGALLANAHRRGLVARNVVRELRSLDEQGVDNRAQKRQKGKLRVGVDIPTRQEIKALVDHLQGRWRPIILTAIFTGLRSSELRGLRWIDVYLKKNELHVRQRVDQYREFGAPKSGSGERAIPLPPIIVNTLKEWKLACPNGADGLCFPTGNGSPENHANLINRGLIPAWIAAGVVNSDGSAKYTGLHALRHFYASWCINSKADGGLELSAKAAQSRLGHSTIMMTFDTYGHLFPRGDDGSELADAEKSLLG